MVSCYVETVMGRRTCDRHVVWIEGLLCSRITQACYSGAQVTVTFPWGWLPPCGGKT